MFFCYFNYLQPAIFFLALVPCEQNLGGADALIGTPLRGLEARDPGDPGMGWDVRLLGNAQLPIFVWF